MMASIDATKLTKTEYSVWRYKNIKQREKVSNFKHYTKGLSDDNTWFTYMDLINHRGNFN